MSGGAGRAGGRPGFLFVTCQIGAERAVKHELAQQWPDFRLAYSRPGFLTFKLPAAGELRADFDLGSVFARAYAFSLGRVNGQELDEMAERVWEFPPPRTPQRIHVWQRDSVKPGEQGFATPVNALAYEVAERIGRACRARRRLASDATDLARPAQPGETVLDCVIVGPHEWWVGYHQVRDTASAWSGGAIPVHSPPDAVSRAFLKMEESLCWSALPIPVGARCAELGSAPGGASQALLRRGMRVLGIDPAEMHPAVLAHPNFTHLRRRVNQVRRREFRRIRWLMADMNVAPTYTLDAVEAIVTHPEIHIRGMLLTLKLVRWELASQVPRFLDRVRSWGYNQVRARQLLYHRQEICVAALRRPFTKTPVRR